LLEQFLSSLIEPTIPLYHPWLQLRIRIDPVLSVSPSLTFSRGDDTRPDHG
jgi:hypothetical protein